MFMQAVVQAAEALDGGGAVVAEDVVHLVEAELVVAGGNGGVGGEDALLADGFDVGFGGVAERCAGELLFEQADGEQGGVALVHVVDLGLARRGRGAGRRRRGRGRSPGRGGSRCRRRRGGR